MGTIIKNAYILTMNETDTIFENGCVVIDGEKIAFVGKSCDDYDENGFDVIDAKGNIVMPGLVNAHTHLPMTIFKGYGEGLPLDRWLSEKIWPAEALLTDEIVYWTSMLGLCEMAKTGTTSFLDMYYFYDAIAKAVRQSGHRATFARGILDADGGGEQRLKKAIAVYDKYHGEKNISVMLAPHAEYTNSAKMLARIGKEAKKRGAAIHIHISETILEHQECEQRNGMTPIQFLDKLGVTDNPIAAAHCVYVDDRDIEIMAEKNVSVLSCPQSNLKLGSGIAPVKKMLDAGVCVGVGTDGSSSNNNLDMIEETMLISLLQRGTLKDANAISDLSALKLATTGSAKAIGLGGRVGQIKAGMLADIIMIDTDNIAFTPRNDLVSCVINSGNGNHVCMTMIGGKIIYKAGQVLFADENEVRQKVTMFADEILN
jgi:5-methylthioadenosine/S-adenosylhomocysteine deaminase